MTASRFFILAIATAAILGAQTGTTGPIGNFTVAAGGCLTGAVTITGAMSGAVVTVTPETFPGNGIYWSGYISAANTVTVKVCNAIAGYIPASLYDVSVGGGAIGPTGPTGPTGPAGPNGATGPTGPGGALTQIARQVLAAPAATVTFSAIPATFNSLQLVFMAKSSQGTSATDSVFVHFNGDSGTDYDYSYLNVTGSGGAVGAGVTGQTNVFWGGVAGTSTGFPGSANVTMPEYAQTTFYKQGTLMSTSFDAGTPNFYFQSVGFEWRNTAAISSIVLNLGSGSNFVTGSTFTLYGIN